MGSEETTERPMTIEERTIYRVGFERDRALNRLAQYDAWAINVIGINQQWKTTELTSEQFNQLVAIHEPVYLASISASAPTFNHPATRNDAADAEGELG